MRAYNAKPAVPKGKYQGSGDNERREPIAHDDHTWPNGVCGHCGATQQAAGIGLEPTLSDWLANIVAVSREVWRVLRDDGTYWLNLGDAYSGGGKRGAIRNYQTGALAALTSVSGWGAGRGQRSKGQAHNAAKAAGRWGRCAG